jgi:hypothetical protein
VGQRDGAGRTAEPVDRHGRRYRRPASDTRQGPPARS